MQTTGRLWTLRKALLALALVALLAVVATSAMDFNTDPAFQEQLIGRLYSNYLKVKRSPSIGLSLAEYMAQPQGQGDLHFIENGRK